MASDKLHYDISVETNKFKRKIREDMSMYRATLIQRALSECKEKDNCPCYVKIKNQSINQTEEV